MFKVEAEDLIDSSVSEEKRTPGYTEISEFDRPLALLTSSSDQALLLQFYQVACLSPSRGNEPLPVALEDPRQFESSLVHQGPQPIVGAKRPFDVDEPRKKALGFHGILITFNIAVMRLYTSVLKSNLRIRAKSNFCMYFGKNLARGRRQAGPLASNSRKGPLACYCFFVSPFSITSTSSE